MKNTCERCGAEYMRWQGNQRFCSSDCSKAFFAEERRAAVEAYRRAKPRDPVTYHQLGLAGAISDAGGGGRFARREPVAVEREDGGLGDV